MKNLKRIAALVLAFVFAMALLAGCGSSGGGSTPAGSGADAGGDGVIKINQAIPDYFGKDNLRDLTGITAVETEQGMADLITPEALDEELE